VNRTHPNTHSFGPVKAEQQRTAALL